LMFAPAGSAPQINQRLDPEKQRFRQLFAFQLVQRGDQLFGAQTNTTGPFALLEFTGALPRAKLYSQWESGREDEEVLKQLTTRAFDPETHVLVADPLPAANPGTVAITSYEPKKVVLRANLSASAVLVLHDRYDPAWRVKIDGQPASLLRCNFIMRGVALPPGEHEVVMEFKPPTGPLKVTLAGLVSWLLLAFLITKSRATTAQSAFNQALSTRPQ
jgi:hypothetical protein